MRRMRRREKREKRGGEKGKEGEKGKDGEYKKKGRGREVPPSDPALPGIDTVLWPDGFHQQAGQVTVDNFILSNLRFLNLHKNLE